jgi:hypothetical protein
MLSPDTEPDEKPEPWPGYRTDLHVVELTARDMDMIGAAIGATLGFYVVETLYDEGQVILSKLFTELLEKVSSLGPKDA